MLILGDIQNLQDTVPRVPRGLKFDTPGLDLDTKTLLFGYVMEKSFKAWALFTEIQLDNYDIMGS